MKRTYTFFLVVIGAALLLEAEGPSLTDPWAQLGWYFHADISSWPLSRYLPVHIVVSLLEISLIITALLWWKRKRRFKEAFRFIPGTLITPVLVFSGMLAFGVLYGLASGGDFTFALWEVRGFLMMVGVYLLTGIFIREEKHLNHLVWVILIASVALAIENMLRLAFFGQALEANDLAFDHVDSMILMLGMVLSLNLLAFGGTRAQKRFAAIAIPVILLATELMKRRAAFVVLVIGIVVLTIFLLRLRPRLFWKIVPPLAVLFAIYLIIFWHDSSPIGQPARAISSQFTPDPRDFASNLYRFIEHTDIILNIQTAPITGLGFGRQFIFYYPVANVGANWPFWHYTTHNAVLWVWMKNGALGFLAFWWLLGRATYDGARAVETQREEWAFVARLRSRLGNRKAPESLWKAAIPLGSMLLRPSAGASKYTGKRKHVPPQAFGLNVPGWERTDKMRSVTARRSGAVALLIAGVCAIPMQVTYSYVDLGLTSERDMLLFGLMLGIIGRGALLLGTQQEKHRLGTSQEAQRPAARRPRRRTGRPMSGEVAPAQLLSPEEIHEAVRSLVAPRATGSPRSRSGASQTQPVTRPLSRPLSRPLDGGAEEYEAEGIPDVSGTPWLSRRAPAAASARDTTPLPRGTTTRPLNTDDLVTTPLSSSPLPAESIEAGSPGRLPQPPQAQENGIVAGRQSHTALDRERERLPWEHVPIHDFEG